MVMKEVTKTITFRVDSETKFAIEMAAHEENRSVNNWILNVIRNHFREQNAKKIRTEKLISVLKYLLYL